MDEQVQHVVTLLTHLQTHLHPVQRRRLEKLGRLERSEQVSENRENVFRSVHEATSRPGENVLPRHVIYMKKVPFK